MGEFDFKGRFANTARLAELFGISERQVQRLVQAGVLEPCDNGKTPYELALNKWGPEILEALQLRYVCPDDVTLSPKLLKK